MNKTFIDRQTSSISKRDVWIEILRFFCICFIMYHHFLNVNPFPLLWIYGQVGVFVFLIISGAFNWQSTKFRTPKFFFKMTINFFWGMIIYLGLFFGHIEGTPPQNFFLGQFICLRYTTWWFVGIYLILTLFQPLINMYVHKCNKWIVLISIVVLFGLISVFNTFDPNSSHQFTQITFVKVIMFITMYLIGAWYGKYCKQWLNSQKVIKFIFIILGFAIFFSIERLFYHHFITINIPYFFNLFTDFINLGVGMCIFTLFDNLPKIISTKKQKVGLFLGQISLSCYLWHPFVGDIMDLFYPAPQEYMKVFLSILMVIVYLIVFILISTCMYYFTTYQENFIKKLYIKYKNKKTSV